MTERARKGGQLTYVRHGGHHMAMIGAAGQDSLSRRIAEEYGIPEDAPDYLARLAVAKRQYMAAIRRKSRDATARQGQLLQNLR